MEKRYYIAYGSNLNIRQMKMRCPGAKAVGTSEIEDYELLYKGSKTGAYLTIEKKRGGKVPVVIWEVTPSDEVALDYYEGCPTFYYKTDMTVRVKEFGSTGSRLYTAFVYIMHEDRPIGIPTQTYVNACLEGYIHFGFDEHYLANAQIKSMEEKYGYGKNRKH